jgi:tetratricopeptide (TPR) repeat protein
MAEARRLFERALAIREKALGPEHAETATSLHNLAQHLHDQKDYVGARLLHERALAIREKTRGPEHEETAQSLFGLAELLHVYLNDSAGARILLERALPILEKKFGPENLRTANSLQLLGILLFDQGDLASAQQLFERVVAIQEKSSGADPTDTARNLSYARTLRDLGEIERARPLFWRAIEISETTHGVTHPFTQRLKFHFGRLLLMTGCPNKALSVAEAALLSHEAAEDRNDSWANHSWTRDSVTLKADALDAFGHAEEAAAIRVKYTL